jgi:hypothetical protein
MGRPDPPNARSNHDHRNELVTTYGLEIAFGDISFTSDPVPALAALTKELFDVFPIRLEALR